MPSAMTKTKKKTPKAAAQTSAPSPAQIMQLGLAFWGSKTLLSAIELGLFTELTKGPLDGPAITKRLNLHGRCVHDFLDALVALGMLKRASGRYANTPETELFLDRAKPSYMGGILEMANKRLYPFWGSLTEALRTGRPQNEVKSGANPFAELYSDVVRLEEFLRAMTGISLGPSRMIAQKFPWKDYKTFIDIGTAQGALPVQAALAHPHLTGIGADLPVVKPIFENYVSSFGLEKRLRFMPCDFFKEALPRADVVVMGHILHDWNLEEKRMLIGKVYDALPAGGAFIIYEALIDDDRSQNAFGLLMSLNMLIETPGGFDYTGAQACEWLSEAGFKKTRVDHLIGPDSMVVGIK